MPGTDAADVTGRTGPGADGRLAEVLSASGAAGAHRLPGAGGPRGLLVLDFS